MILGWAIYAVAYVGFGLADSAWQIAGCFLLYAVHYALVEPAEKAWVAQLVDEQQRGLAYGWFNFAIGIAALPASLLFGWIYQTWGALMAFSWGAALAFAASIMLLRVRVVKVE